MKIYKMDPTTMSIFFLIFSLFNFSTAAPPEVYGSNLDNNQLVYKHCENQTSKDDQSSSIISSFFQEVLQGSTRSTFLQTNAGNDQMAVSGLFQCRGDLSNDDCNKCVRKLPHVSKNLCGSSIPARVQLFGCHIHYQADGIFQTSRLQLLHKTCSHQTGSAEFQEQRDAAFSAIQECVQGGQGYCELNFEPVHLMAQCDGNLEACDCIGCVNYAMDSAQEQCGYSVSGEIYMDGCYIRYSYNNYGVNGGSNDDGSRGSNSNRLVAIAIGGIIAASAAVGFGYFCMNRGKKKDEF